MLKFMGNILLIFLLCIPITGIISLLMVSSSNHLLLKKLALNFSCLTLMNSLLLWVFFKSYTAKFQFVVKLLWIPHLNFNLLLGIDGISLFFIILTSLLIPLCLLVSWHSVRFNVKEFLICFLIMEFFLLAVFSVLDLFLFYIFFESVLIPMFLVIGVWGSRERKVRAAYFFFLYTLVGSVLMLLAVLYVYYQVGTTDYEILTTFSFSKFEQNLL